MCLKLLANRNAWYSVTETALTFAQLVERLGGFTPANIESWVFVKSPFTLSHWTMNVVEVLLIVGALWGLRHSVARFKAGESVYLGFWLASVLFMLALEIPVYFPEKLGAPDNALFFIHNEFSVQFFFGRAPLYILALYPAIMYASFVLVRQAGLFDQRWGALIGALGVGVVHHVFYEIFDHFGPQYGWWTWNYPNFTSSLASVPVSSMVGFAFVGPIALTLATQLLVPKSVVAHNADAKDASRRIRSFAIGTLLTLGQLLRLTTFSSRGLWAYSKAYLVLFLGVFTGLWLYALPDYFSAVEGITSQGYPVGSLPYVLGCSGLAIFFLLRERRQFLSRDFAFLISKLDDATLFKRAHVAIPVRVRHNVSDSAASVAEADVDYKIEVTGLLAIPVTFPKTSI